jgi:hypothetical protein
MSVHFQKLHLIPLSHTTQLAVEQKHQYGTTFGVESIIHFHCNGCSVENSL